MGKWFTKPTEPSSDQDPDIAVDIESEDSYSPDTVHCITVDGEVVQPVHLQTLLMMIRSQIVVALLTLTLIQPVCLLQVLPAISNRQVIYLMMILSLLSQLRLLSGVTASKTNLNNQWLTVTTLLVE